jgi:hypothetical protein
MGDILSKLICCGEEVHKEPITCRHIEILHVKANILIEEELKSALHNNYSKNKYIINCYIYKNVRHRSNSCYCYSIRECRNNMSTKI